MKEIKNIGSIAYYIKGMTIKRAAVKGLLVGRTREDETEYILSVKDEDGLIFKKSTELFSSPEQLINNLKIEQQ